MGENTHIAWAHHTFNPWLGCKEVSPGCANCYAKVKANHRWPSEKLWDPKLNNRNTMAESTWKNLGRWNRRAKKAGINARLFVGSMCDIADPFGPESERAKMFAAPKLYPWLTFMFLTKRVVEFLEYALKYWPDGIPENVWFGFTAEDQKRFDERWDIIQQWLDFIPGPGMWGFSKIFMSLEPALGPIDLSAACNGGDAYKWLDLVIAGGERGVNARCNDIEWMRSMRDQCEALGIDFMFKQWGEYYPVGIPENLTGSKSFERYNGKHMSIAAAKMTYVAADGDTLAFSWKGGNAPVMERVGLEKLERHGVLDLLDDVRHNGGLV